MNNTLRIFSFPLSGHAHKVELFANVAGIAHEVVNLNLAGGEHKEEAFLAINPTGQVPAITDGDVKLADSNAILVYLARKYAPNFLPTDPLGEAHVQRYLTLAAGDIAYGPAAARLINVFNAALNKEQALMVAKKALTHLERELEGKEFLVNDTVSIADIAVYSYTAHAPEGDVSLDAYPNVRRLLKNVEALDGFVPMPVTKAGLVK